MRDQRLIFLRLTVQKLKALFHPACFTFCDDPGVLLAPVSHLWLFTPITYEATRIFLKKTFDKNGGKRNRTRKFL